MASLQRSCLNKSCQKCLTSTCLHLVLKTIFGLEPGDSVQFCSNNIYLLQILEDLTVRFDIGWTMSGDTSP